MFGRIRYNRTVKIISSLVLIFIILQYCSDVNIPFNNLTEHYNNSLTLNALQQAKRKEIDLENKYQLTAIIVSSNHLPNIRRLVYFYFHTKLFKQIIIWNENQQINLTVNHLLIDNTPLIPIHIINSKEKLRDQAKYRACILAQTSACFYVDENWNVTNYIRSLISSFRSDPNVLHTATDVSTYYNNMLWTYFDTHISLHTGFSWMNMGCVFLREYAQRHLSFLETHLKYNPELQAFSDTYFSIWLNDIPTQLIINPESSLIDQNKQKTDIYPQDKIADFQRKSSIFAIRRLEYTLRSTQSTNNLTFSQHSNRRFPYLIKSPNPTGDFIFFSNILPIDIEHIPFDIKLHAERATSVNIPNGSDLTYFIKHNPSKAIDGDETTCWYPKQFIKKGDFFAIDLLSIRTNITLIFILNHSKELQNSLDIRLSFDGQWWISYPFLFKSTNSEMIFGNLHRLIIESKQFPSELRSFRYIAFNATHRFPESFDICDVKII